MVDFGDPAPSMCLTEAADALEFARRVALDGVREMYSGGRSLTPTAIVLYPGRVRYEPRVGADLRALAVGAVGCISLLPCVRPDRGVGVMVNLEHVDLARDVTWWADLRAQDGALRLGEWEQHDTPPSERGLLRRGARGGQA